MLCALFSLSACLVESNGKFNLNDSSSGWTSIDLFPRYKSATSSDATVSTNLGHEGGAFSCSHLDPPAALPQCHLHLPFLTLLHSPALGTLVFSPTH